jgi:hypothetical protein
MSALKHTNTYPSTSATSFQQPFDEKVFWHLEMQDEIHFPEPRFQKQPLLQRSRETIDEVPLGTSGLQRPHQQLHRQL